MSMFRNKPKPNDPDPGDRNPEAAGGGTPGGETNPDETAALLDDISRQLESAAKERDDALEKWKRALADFQNYQRRAMANEQEAKRQGVTGVLQSVLPVLDHFDVALTPDSTRGSVEQIVQGLAAIRGELLKALETHGIRAIAPGANDAFDPNQHQAIVTQPAPKGVEPGNIISTMQGGYALGDRVIRPAKVIVAAKPES